MGEFPRGASGAEELELSIVMPCLNEAETLEGCIREARAFLEKSGIRGEVVVGDNRSTDGSQQIARRSGARVVDVPVRGYGAALFYATTAARGKYVIMGDSDGSHDYSGLMPFVEKLREGYDLVMGNRFSGGIDADAMTWKNRYIGNPLLSGIGRLFFHCPARDFHCGLRGFTAEAFRKLDLRTTGMEYASEMVIKATLLRMKICEIPIHMRPDGRSRPPHLRPWRDGWRHLRFMLLYSPRWLFFYPGVFLMVVGAAVMTWLLPGPRAVGNLVFDTHTMIFAAFAVLLGFQATTFAVFSKIFAVTEGLVPPSPAMDRVFRLFTLETGLLAGFVLFAAGAAGAIYTVGVWAAHYLGKLEATQFLRLIIVSGVLLSLGCQIVLSSFLLSVMGMSRRYKPREGFIPFPKQVSPGPTGDGKAGPTGGGR